MKLKITIAMDNAAFEDQGTEAARILRELADNLDGQPHLGGLNTRLSDYNGNRVGEAVTTGKANQ